MNNFKAIGKKFIKEVRKLYPENISEAFLFGSAAKNKEKFNSDIDILVIINKKERQIKDSLHSIAADYLLRYNIPIGLKVVDQNTYDSLLNIPTDFYKEIQKTGIRI